MAPEPFPVEMSTSFASCRVAEITFRTSANARNDKAVPRGAPAEGPNAPFGEQWLRRSSPIPQPVSAWNSIGALPPYSKIRRRKAPAHGSPVLWPVR